MLPELPLKPVLAAAALALLWSLEAVIPMFEPAGSRWRHELSNVALGVLNALLVSALFAASSLLVTDWAEQHAFGLLHALRLPGALRWAMAVLALDLWQYVWHRMNHRIPLLWRFHAVHHSDAALSASTAVRFHTGEIVLSSLVRLLVLPLLGLTIGEVLLYEALLLPVILFHHSNIRIPERIDRPLRAVIVTPRMHWVHHSEHRPETDSNYSSILSVWDRLFRSFRIRRDPENLRLGLGLDGGQWTTLRGMLLYPFRAPRRPRVQAGLRREGR